MSDVAYPAEHVTEADLRELVRRESRAAGFDVVRIARLVDLGREPGARLDQFLAGGLHGDMAWLEATADRRRHPLALWPEARSAILLGLSYAPASDPLAVLEEKERGAISVYAQGADYHDILKPKLKQVAGALHRAAGVDVKVFVDTAPVMEKPLAALGGSRLAGQAHEPRLAPAWLVAVSWRHTDHGRDRADAAESDHCGNCRRCLDVCPTDAFPAPYQLDARRCISYLTIEHKGPIDRALRPLIGNRIFGCDDCLAVCPWNKFAQAAHETKLGRRAETDNPPIADLLDLDDASFRATLRQDADQAYGSRALHPQRADRRREFRPGRPRAEDRAAACRHLAPGARRCGVGAGAADWSQPSGRARCHAPHAGRRCDRGGGMGRRARVMIEKFAFAIGLIRERSLAIGTLAA